MQWCASACVVAVLGCQNPSQARLITAGAGGTALAALYFEQEQDPDAFPWAFAVAGAIAFASAFSVPYLERSASHRAPEPEPLDVDEDGPSMINGTDAGIVAAIERHTCVGNCPAYAVAIYVDGTVEYRGDAYVATCGRATGHVDPKTILPLRALVHRAHFTSYEKRYEHPQVTGLPTTIVWFQAVNRRTKVVIHAHGDPEAPAGLDEVEKAIEATANVAHWIGDVGRDAGRCQ